MSYFTGLPAHLQSIVLLTAAALLLLAFGGQFARSVRKTQVLGILACILAALPAWHSDGLTAVATLAPCALALIAMLLLHEADLEFFEHRLDAAGLVLLGAAGAVALGNATELLSLVLGLETVSLVVAVLCGLARGSRGLEAAFKFFVLAAASLGVLLYGTALHVYATGSFSIGAQPLASLTPVYQAAIVLLLLGVAFELAVVPLHFGALSAYMTMPTALATFATTAGKVGALVALLRLGSQLDQAVAGPVLLALGYWFDFVVAAWWTRPNGSARPARVFCDWSCGLFGDRGWLRPSRQKRRTLLLGDLRGSFRTDLRGARLPRHETHTAR